MSTLKNNPRHQRSSESAQSDSDRVQLTHRLLERAATANAEEQRRLQDEAILLNTGLAESIARKYAGRTEDDSDIVQVAYVGLVNAVRRFAPAKGVDFISFAVPTISGEVKRFFRDQGWTVRPPRRIQDLHRQITSATSHLAQVLRRTPTAQEIADHLDEDVDNVNEALACRSCYTPASIDAPMHTDEGTSLSDMLGQEDANFDRSEATTALGPLCRELPSRDQHILFLRFFRGWTQQEIAQELGVTQMQVSRLLARILGQLRAELGSVDASATPGQFRAGPVAAAAGRQTESAGSTSRRAVPRQRAA